MHSANERDTDSFDQVGKGIALFWDDDCLQTEVVLARSEPP